MSAPNTNFISTDVEIVGSILCGKYLVSEGKIIGDIHSTGVLVIGQHGTVKGDIYAESVTIMGKVTGNVTVEQLCELKSQAQLVGDLKAPRLIIEDGATLIGYNQVGAGAAALLKSAAAPVAKAAPALA
jgi:cytoskeletal protein CcmA (bactofilin family)